MNSRLLLFLAAALVLTSTGATLLARTNDPSAATGKSGEKSTEQASEPATSGTPARDESKNTKPTRRRPAWPPPSELIA